MNNTKAKPAGYSLTQIALHWGIALLILIQFLLDDGIGQAWDGFVDTGNVTYSPLVISHIVIGVTVLVLALWRIALKLKVGTPALPEGEPRWQQIASRATHGLLYLLLLLMPLSGLLGWVFSVRLAADIHSLESNLLLGLIGLHVAAALYHRFVSKSGVLERMFRPVKSG